MSAAERFLKRKREEQKNGVSMSMSPIAPSMASRHGLDKMGGYDNSIGRYTGNGPDNIVQPQLPTQRRIDSQGSPYVVDEGEVVVIDAATLKEYGGPEAFEQFVQQNKPSRNRQMYMGGPPTAGIATNVSSMAGGPMRGGTGVGQYAGGGVPAKRYEGGGTPTRSRGFPSTDQLKMLTEVKQGIEQYQYGGSPTEKPQESISPATRTRGSMPVPNPGGGVLNPNVQGGNFINPNQKTPIDIDKGKFDPLKKAVSPTGDLSFGQFGDRPLGVRPRIPTDDPIVNPIVGPIVGPNVDPLNIDPVTTYPDLPEGKVMPRVPYYPDLPEGKVMPRVPYKEDQQGTDPVTGEPIYAPSNVDEMMWNRYLGRMGAQQEAQRAGAAQRGLQAGLSDREIMGRGAIGDIGRREAMAGATSDFAIDVAHRKEAKDQWQQQFDFVKKKYGDLEGGRIASDIAAGMTFEQIKAKYPNMTEADYNSMKEAGSLGDKDWDKQMMKFDTLVAAGDYENAQTVWNEMFPDTPIDFQKLIDEGNMDKFNTGMGQMTKYISSGLTWDEALAAMKKDGTLNNLGLSEKEAKDMYDTLQMKSNPIWQITNAIPDELLKQMFPDMEPDEARALITKLAMFGGMTMNDDGTFNIDEEIMKKIFGGTGTGTGTGDYTYDDYKKDAEAAGGTPLSESDWKEEGSKKWEGVVSLQKGFDKWVTELPPEYDNLGLTPDVWKDLGKPSIDEFADWYKNKGGKNYLILSGQLDRIMSIQPDLNDIANKQGQYSYLRDLPMKEMLAEQRKLMLGMFEGEMGPTEAKEMYRKLFEDFGSELPYNPTARREPWNMKPEDYKDNPKFYTDENLGLVIEQELFDKMKDKGYTDKQIKNMYFGWSAMAFGKVDFAYEYDYWYDGKEEKWKIKD